MTKQTTQQPLTKYAFYGSLRQGMYNNSYFNAGMKYEKTVTIPGFQLFSLGAYPCVIPTTDEKETIVVDLFELDIETSERIKRMEFGAGYDLMKIDIDGTEYGIYVFEGPASENMKTRYVPGGDWVKFLQARNNVQQV